MNGMHPLGENSKTPEKTPRVTLKTVARHLGLTAGTVSAVLNDNHNAHIPKHTRDRIFAAVHELNYQPNPFARALRTGKMAAGRGKAFEVCNAHNTLLIVGAEQLERVLHAIEQAGFRVQEDCFTFEMGEDPAAWISQLRRCRITGAANVDAGSAEWTKDLPD